LPSKTPGPVRCECAWPNPMMLPSDPINRLHFSALSASPRTPREMMHGRPGLREYADAPCPRQEHQSVGGSGAPLSFAEYVALFLNWTGRRPEPHGPLG
jgi:hypothetical protein